MIGFASVLLLYDVFYFLFLNMYIHVYVQCNTPFVSPKQKLCCVDDKLNDTEISFIFFLNCMLLCREQHLHLRVY